MNVLFRAVAEAEVTEAWAHYDAISPDLGDDFLVRVDAAVTRIAANPEAYEVVHRDLRRIRLRRFPHLLVFRVVGDVSIVVACTHPRQHPDGWSGRR